MQSWTFGAGLTMLAADQRPVVVSSSASVWPLAAEAWRQPATPFASACMRRRALRIGLIVAPAIVACNDPGWRRGPVEIGPTPVVLRPPQPLVAGRVATDLCVGVPDSILAPPMRSLAEPLHWDTAGFRLASGRLLHIRAVLHAEGDATAPTVTPSVRGAPGRPTAICFGGPLAQPEPNIVALELWASEPLRLTYVEWTPVNYGSL